MDLELKGKRALVTGSSDGIGKAIAIGLAREGAKVIIHGRNADKARRVVEEIKSIGGDCGESVGELNSDAGVEQIVRGCISFAGGVDVLVNNAGSYVNRGWSDATPKQWTELYEINVVSIVRLVRALIPGMQKNRWGRIINIASGEATQPFAFMPDYASTKAAVVNLTVSLSKFLAGSGVTVNTVSPGLILTDPLREFYQKTASQRGWGTEWKEIEAHMLSEILPNTVGRLGAPDDVARLIAFLASPLSGYINGANYRIDGGSTTSIN
jgi:3-oxoacyl-[acyl-carrier protein] reductase